MKRPQFSLSTLLLLTVAASMAIVARVWYEEARKARDELRLVRDEARNARKVVCRLRQQIDYQEWKADRNPFVEAKLAKASQEISRLRDKLWRQQWLRDAVEAPPVESD